MFIHGKEDEAEELVQEIESRVEDSTDEQLEEVDEDITVHRVPLAGIVDFIAAKRAEGVAADVRLLLLLGPSILT